MTNFHILILYFQLHNVVLLLLNHLAFLFEDFLYFNAEMYLGKHISIIKNTNWDEFFQAFYKMFAKFCTSCENFKEIPEIPFSISDLIFKGKTVSKIDWVSTVEK